MAEFIALATQATAIQARLGGKVELASKTFAGEATGELVFTVRHDTLSALAAYTERLAADEEWQRLWATNIASNPNPVGRILSHSIMNDVPGF